MTSPNGMSASAEELLGLFLRFNRALDKAHSLTLQDTAAAITRLTVESIAGAEQASISEGRNGRFRTLGSTGPMATGGDDLQYELRSGPCVDALSGDVVYRTVDVGADARWPEFARRATAETGTVSLMSFRLFFEDDIDRVTGLNIYSSRRGAFDDTAQTVGTVLATHSARALLTAAARDKAVNLQQALESNREIGTAMGIIMAIHKVTREDAFSLLRIASQNSNRKLIDIATDVVDTGMLDLPTATARRSPRASD